MKEKTRTAILERLNDNTLINRSSSPPNNYPSLRNNIIHREFKREKKVLRKMLQNPATFAAEFKKRCRWRVENTEQVFSFNEMPESLSNILYWDVAIHPNKVYC
jgi:hypothetical protein